MKLELTAPIEAHRPGEAVFVCFAYVAVASSAADSHEYMSKLSCY